MTAKSVKKRDLTRARVIRAAIDCISTVGFNAAHTNRIAETAGVSWGVLQYHFGDKDGLLEAVLNHVFDEFTASLADTVLEGEELEQRVAHLIEVIWSLVSQKEYRVSLAILRNAGKDEGSTIDGQKRIDLWARRISELWDELFAGNLPVPEQSDTARRLMFAALRGMADEVNPRGRSEQALQEERQALARAVTYLLTANTKTV